MVDLIAEFVEIDLHNQQVIKDKAKYLPIYTVHPDGTRSLIARYVKQIDLERSEEYDKYFREFPTEVLIGKK